MTTFGMSVGSGHINHIYCLQTGVFGQVIVVLFQ